MIISNFLSSEHWRMWLGFSVSLFFPDEKLEQHQEHSLTHGKQQTKSQGFFEASSAVPKTNALFVFALLSTHHCSSEVSLPSHCWTSAKSKDPTERDLGRHSPFSQVPKTCLRLRTSHYWGTFLKCWCFLLDGSGVPPPHSSCCNSQHFPHHCGVDFTAFCCTKLCPIAWTSKHHVGDKFHANKSISKYNATLQ